MQVKSEETISKKQCECKEYILFDEQKVKFSVKLF